MPGECSFLAIRKKAVMVSAILFIYPQSPVYCVYLLSREWFLEAYRSNVIEVNAYSVGVFPWLLESFVFKRWFATPFLRKRKFLSGRRSY